MKIELTQKEQQVIGSYMRTIAAADAAKANLSAVSSIIIERAGMDSSKPWALDPSGTFLEEVKDGLASE